MKKTFFCCLMLFILLSATNCKKSNTSGSTGDYQPITAGSEWNYTVTGSNAGTYKVTMLNRDTIVNGKTYRVASNSASVNEYYAKIAGEYFRYNKLAELNNQTVELLYLKDQLAKGQSWTEVKSINASITGFGTVPITASFVFTIADKGISHVVNGVTFKDVIKVTAVPSFTALGSPIPVNSFDLQYFYARNVGLINSKTSLVINLAGINSTSETQIGSYTIK
jgi:hypothetical protein